MDIKRAGSQPSNKGPADWFTGTVRMDPLFQASHPARATGASVTFEPGARTACHTHPLGQTLNFGIASNTVSSTVSGEGKWRISGTCQALPRWSTIKTAALVVAPAPSYARMGCSP
jgi:hypothetical protein